MQTSKLKIPVAAEYVSSEFYMFEFMDQEWVPLSLRLTLREVVECGCSKPLQPYYENLADTVEHMVTNEGFTQVVELGAGAAPVTRLLSKREWPDNVKLFPCDLTPDDILYKDLERQNPKLVAPIYAPIDFSIVRNWPANTLLVISSAFHHIPPSDRANVIRALTSSARRVVVFECLRKNFISVFLVLFNFITVFLTPLVYFNRPGKLRRFIWCWFIPLAFPLIVWDGIISCFRMWSNKKFITELKKNIPADRVIQIKNTISNQMVSW